MHYHALALLGALHVLIFTLSAQEIPSVGRVVRMPGASTFHVRLTKKIDAGKARIGERIAFKSDMAILIGKTVVPPADFFGRVVYVQTPGENAEQESRLSILVEEAKWKDASLPLCAYVVGFGSYRVTIEHLGSALSGINVESQAPRRRDFADSGAMPNRGRIERDISPNSPLDVAKSTAPRTLQHLVDYSGQLKGIKLVRAKVDSVPRTILVRRRKNIVLPKSLPVMLEQTNAE